MLLYLRCDIITPAAPSSHLLVIVVVVVVVVVVVMREGLPSHHGVVRRKLPEGIEHLT